MILMRDGFVPATTEMVVLCKSSKRYFDLDAVRQPGNSMDRDGEKRGGGYGAKAGTDGVNGFSRDCPTITNHPAGAPPLDWWKTDTPDTHPESGEPLGTARLLIGDVFERLATIPDNSVDLVLTSPPFLALRSYLPADHPDKGKEIGSEATPGAFIDVLLALTEEWARVLAPHGSICVELGDTFSGSGGAGGDYNADGLRDGQQKFSGSASKRARLDVGDDYRPARNGRAVGWPLAKSLCMIPELYRISLVYGFNPLTGRETPRWRARNVVRWTRPNPPVGALGDKFRPATSDMVVACTSGSRYFDLDAVRVMTDRHAEQLEANATRHGGFGHDDKRNHNHGKAEFATAGNPAGAPPLDWWNIPTEAYQGAHYACWPKALLTRPILAMCPSRVCRECGKPSERITAIDKTGVDSRTVSAKTEARHAERVRDTISPEGRVQAPSERAGIRTDTSASVTLGWTDCGHGDWRPGLVLDPFGGSGTTGQVATGHGRDCLMIDIDPRNADLARERCGMFLEVEYPDPIVKGA